MTFGSLFSGIGGFDFGFEQGGMKCLWQVEIDKSCLNVLSHHWANVEKFKDVKECGKQNLKPVDIICGGFPCQDLSVAGRRKGIAEERSGLWFEFERIIGELTPRWVVVENVPGLLSSNKGHDFAIVIQGLVKFGYGVAWSILNAQYFGVAQRRRRVFIVGSLGDGSCAEILFEHEGVSRDTQEGRKARKSTSAPIKASSPNRRNGGSDPIDSEFVFGVDNSDVEYLLRANSSHSGDKDDSGINTTLVAGTLGANAGGLNRPAGNCNELDFCIPVAATLNSGGTNGGFRTEPGEHLIVLPLLAKLNNSFDHTLETYIFDWQSGGDVRYNISSERASALHASQTKAVNQNGVRRLTPLECERLQGFPDEWTAGQSDSTRYRQLGNAVAVPMAKWIAKRIVEYECA